MPVGFMATNALLYALCKNHRIKEAITRLENLRPEKLRVNLYNTVISFCTVERK